MKNYLLLLGALFLVSCSASRNKETRLKIKERYEKLAEKNKAEKSSKPKTKPRIKTKSTKETLIATSKVNVTTDAISAYIEKYKNLAMENMRIYGIPASIKLAQGILESGSGNGKLSKEANNHFGIKCKKSWKGEFVFLTDDAPDECFRKYASAKESYSDHSEFIANRIYYKNLFLLPKDDYKGWAYGLKKAGYATDKKYPEKLISLIERYQLYKFDQTVLN